jgi:uncharacterized protein YjiS (DUF1127 family)
MATPWDWSTAETYDSAERRATRERRFGASVATARMLRLWRDRHRRRQELAMLLDGDLKDIGVAREMVAHEARKWPWQPWHPSIARVGAGGATAKLGRALSRLPGRQPARLPCYPGATNGKTLKCTAACVLASGSE